MATKSVIEIEIIDEQFKAFDAQLKAMQASIAKMPEQWKKVTKEVNEEQKAEKKTASDAEKARKKALQEEKEHNKVLKERKRDLADIASSSVTIAGNMASAAVSVAKWLALGAIGGGFGLGALASSASDARRQAKGLGISTGQLRAANVNLGRYINPEGVLGNIADIQSDLSRRQILGRLGGAPGQDPAQMLPSVMRNAVQQFKAGGQTSQYAEAMGLTQVFTLEELRRMASLSEKELQTAFSKMQADVEKFKVSDDTSRQWQEFWVQLRTAGNAIEVSFIKNLTALTPQLIKFSETVTEAITNLLSSDEFKDAVERFAKYLSTPEFTKNVSDFIEGIGELASGLLSIMRKLGLVEGDEVKEREKAIAFQRKLAKEDYDKMTPAQRNFLGVRDPSKTLAEVNNNFGNLRFVGQAGATKGEGGFAKFDSPQAGFKALQSQLQLYASGGSQAAGYKKLDTIESIMGLYAPKGSNNTEAYIQMLEKQMGRGRAEHLNFSDTNTLATMMAGISRMESGKNLYSPDAVKVIIQNNTGGSTTANVAAAPGAGGK